MYQVEKTMIVAKMRQKLRDDRIQATKKLIKQAAGLPAEITSNAVVDTHVSDDVSL